VRRKKQKCSKAGSGGTRSLKQQCGEGKRKRESEETMDENNAGGMAIETTERLQAAAERLEKTLACLEERQAALTGDVARIVATVDATADTRQRELERKLEEAEQQIAELKAQAATPLTGRKTLPVATMQLLAKQGIGSVEGLEAGSLDTALAGLSLEQRVAVKAQLIRTGALA
jgi:cell division protein ZapA (FtsZ GTPase activity inhibitor)